jgi:phosphatidate cytidylyltransferase
MLRWRMLLGTLIIALLVGLCWLDERAAVPGIWLLPVTLLFTLLASGEVLYLARAGGMRPLAWPVYCGNLLLVLAQWLPPADQAVFWPLTIGVLLVFLGEMVRYEQPGGVTANIAAAAFALVYVGAMLVFAVQLRMQFGIGAMASWIIIVKMGDTGAYTVGRLIGRHKMAPLLSPGKTIEGAVGALVFACLASWACFRWLAPAITPAGALHASGWGWLLCGILLGSAGMLGDLAESLLKRDAGCKDSSTWVPGFGGVLDILDSLLLSAPVAWMCWQWGVAGR